jgi:nucleotide-binding universal stress UspA family protein
MSAAAARIVVGVDGSEESRAALRWALAEARLRQAPLTAVHAWSDPIVPSGDIAPPAPLAPPEILRAEAEELLESVVAAEAEDAEDVVVRRVVVEGAADEVLVEASRGADLLVVGSRGLGGIGSLLLGSVSRHCARHASCPVVIVRAPPPTADAAGR